MVSRQLEELVVVGAGGEGGEGGVGVVGWSLEEVVGVGASRSRSGRRGMVGRSGAARQTLTPQPSKTLDLEDGGRP